MSFKNSIVSLSCTVFKRGVSTAVCSFDAMHKGKLPQFKRHKAFGQYKNRTPGGTYLASPLRCSVHKFPVALLLPIFEHKNTTISFLTGGNFQFYISSIFRISSRSVTSSVTVPFNGSISSKRSPEKISLSQDCSPCTSPTASYTFPALNSSSV